MFPTTNANIHRLDLGLDPVDIQFTTTSEGRPSGECYVEFPSAGEAQRAQQKHQASMGSRYVEGKSSSTQ